MKKNRDLDSTETLLIIGFEISPPENQGNYERAWMKIQKKKRISSIPNI